MNNVFLWVGFFAITGLTLAAGVAAWLFVLTYILQCLCETYWIVAFKLWCFGHKEAKRYLEMAIRADSKKNSNGDESVQRETNDHPRTD